MTDLSSSTYANPGDYVDESCPLCHGLDVAYAAYEDYMCDDCGTIFSPDDRSTYVIDDDVVDNLVKLVVQLRAQLP